MKPLFVDHPPSPTANRLWFISHVHKEGKKEKAEKAALDQAFMKFSDRLTAKGYPLTAAERDRWFRLGPKDVFPSISDRWIRTYKESSDKPFLHRTSLYLLLSIPRTYERKLLASLVKGDRRSARVMIAKEKEARAAWQNGRGAHFLYALREALKADRTIHSDASFQGEDRIRIPRKQKALESLWRKSLRAVKLSLIPPTDPFSLGEFPNPPIVLKEEARIQSDSGPIGLEGLVFKPSLHPFHAPEHLVFPGLASLIKDPRSILSSEILSWETHLFREPSYRNPLFLEMTCSSTDSAGTGHCLLSRVHVPGHHGYIEGYYRPSPGTRLDTPFFRKFLNKSILEAHFRFYHRRALHPILLSLNGLSPDIKKPVETLFIENARKENLTLCLSSGKDFECPGGPPPSLLFMNHKYRMRISVLSEQTTTQPLTGFSISSERLHLKADLSDSSGLFWMHEMTITARGLSRDNAISAAWKECARKLSRDLSLVFYPPARSHPGEDLYDR